MLFICPFVWNPKISVGEKLLVIVARNWGKTCFSPPSSRNWVSLGESLGRKVWLSSLNYTLRKGNVLFYQWRIELKWNSSMMWIPLTRELVVTTFLLKAVIWSEEIKNLRADTFHLDVEGVGGGCITSHWAFQCQTFSPESTRLLGDWSWRGFCSW